MNLAGERILIVAEDPHLRTSLARLVSDLGQVSESETKGADLASLRGAGIDVVIADLGPPGAHAGSADRMIEELRNALPDALILAMSARSDRQAALKVAESGAYGFLTKPVDPGEIRLLVRLAVERRRRDRDLARLQEEVESRHDVHAIVGASAPIEVLRSAIQEIAGTETDLLIHGERGSGRELAARVIHFNSPRRRGPFVAVSTSLLPGHQIEADIFGGREGPAGSGRRRTGKAGLADRGTLFLDDVAALPPAAQTRLLQLIETGEIEGALDLLPAKVDLRLMAATARDLDVEVAARRFRKDLRDRLAAARLDVPPLRERRDDIPMLAAHFLSRAHLKNGLDEKKISPGALACLMTYPWPGNVRELEHLMENLAILNERTVLEAEDLPPHLRGPSAPIWPPPSIPEEGFLWERQVERFERSLLEQALRLTNGKKSAAAQRLGLKKDQMKYLCRKYGL